MSSYRERDTRNNTQEQYHLPNTSRKSSMDMQSIDNQLYTLSMMQKQAEKTLAAHVSKMQDWKLQIDQITKRKHSNRDKSPPSPKVKSVIDEKNLPKRTLIEMQRAFEKTVFNHDEIIEMVKVPNLKLSPVPLTRSQMGVNSMIDLGGSITSPNERKGLTNQHSHKSIFDVDIRRRNMQYQFNTAQNSNSQNRSVMENADSSLE